jgi:hypothetical protein
VLDRVGLGGLVSHQGKILTVAEKEGKLFAEIITIDGKVRKFHHSPFLVGVIL